MEEIILKYFEKNYDGIESMYKVSQKLKIRYGKFLRIAKKLNVWQPNQSGKGIYTIELDDVFSNKIKMRSSTLRKKLIKAGLKKEECEECKIKDWNGKKIVFELDHIDGNNENNSFDNLKILCPNCHSQTPTFRGRKIK